MITKEDKVKFFVNELGDITDPKIRDFAKKMIEEADDYFFVVPASSSGKYHPTFDLGDGGLVRHTRCVAYYAGCIAESFMFSQRDKDIIILAGLAHDIKKQGNGEGRHTVTEHPILAADYVLSIAKEMPDVFTADELNKLTQAIRSHMGKWGAKDGLPAPESEFDKCLQAADYIASRKEILDFNFRPTDEVKVEKPEVKPADFIIDFGKYKGKGMTVREIHEKERAEGLKDTTYIEWMAGMDEFFNKDAQAAARAYLAEIKNAAPSVPEPPVNEAPLPTVEPPFPIDDLPF